MDFKDRLYQLSEKVTTHKQDCKTEEATKTALILPFISALGYDTFNPREVVPEVDCDIRRTGDKVDYVIMDGNGSHLMLIECKYWRRDLDNYVSQLASYFAASNARFGILTNGVEYRFYADLDRANLMDNEPFMVVDMERLDDLTLERLCMFCKEQFEEHRIVDEARSMRSRERLTEVVEGELTNPSPDFVRYFAKLVFGRTLSVREREGFSNMLKDTIHNYVQKVNINNLQLADNLHITPPTQRTLTELEVKHLHLPMHRKYSPWFKIYCRTSFNQAG